jgi:epoxyqueuosine reductase QueG
MTEMLFFEEREFQDRFGCHPISRAKHAGWLRNLCAVLGNLKIRDSLDPLNQLAQISDNEMVIIAARQAIRKIKE